jgi:hypothetical protein
MLKLPEALPISAGATALYTAFCDACMASDTPAPAISNGATSCAKASSGVAMSAIQTKPVACVNRPALTNRRSPNRLTRLAPIGAKTQREANCIERCRRAAAFRAITQHQRDHDRAKVAR